MKILMSKDWATKFEDDDYDDGCCMAMSPELHMYSEATTLAEVNEVAGHLCRLVCAEHDMTDDGHQRFIWGLEKLIKYVKRTKGNIA